jgi:hypothetical protein
MPVGLWSWFWKKISLSSIFTVFLIHIYYKWHSIEEDRTISARAGYYTGNFLQKNLLLAVAVIVKKILQNIDFKLLQNILFSNHDYSRNNWTSKKIKRMEKAIPMTSFVLCTSKEKINGVNDINNTPPKKHKILARISWYSGRNNNLAPYTGMHREMVISRESRNNIRNRPLNLFPRRFFSQKVFQPSQVNFSCFLKCYSILKAILYYLFSEML